MQSPDESPAARQRMIAEQLKARGINSSKVLSVIGRIPREWFVADDLKVNAYADQALPIDCGQTISQPFIVALMTQALELTGQQQVLEVGTGSGYQTAILASLAGQVVSIERHAQLLQSASNRLNQLGIKNVHLVLGDGHQGWSPGAPYDRIIITAAARQCPPPLLDQLSNNGILVGPFGESDSQTLQVIRRIHGRDYTTALTPCRFVPLVAGEREC